MIAYFSIKENSDKLNNLLFDFLDTPYWHMGRDKNGLDCIGLVAEVARILDIINTYVTPYYAQDWYLHDERQILLDGIMEQIKYLRKNLALIMVDKTDTLINGDIVCLATRNKGKYNHCGFYLEQFGFLEKQIVHAMERLGVISSDINFYTKYPFKVIRLWQLQ